MNRGSSGRWVLAFDASCGTCREISGAVKQACEDKLEVLPLANVEVRQWREQALGADAEWVPTLLRINEDQVRAWTGPAMAAPLARWLGPVTTVRVVHALGRLRRRARGKASELPGARTDLPAIGRAQFLRLCAGVGVAAGLVLTGKAPAFATEEKQTAHAWVHAHRNNLPHTYDQVVKYPQEYRRAIFQALPPSVRSQLWTEHLKHYRQANPHLTAQQRDILDRAAALAARESTFSAPQTDQKLRQQVDEIYKSATAAFGARESYKAFGVLGPESAPELAKPDCECAFGHDYCRNSGMRCHNANYPCNEKPSGCGWLWREPCQGLCW